MSWFSRQADGVWDFTKRLALEIGANGKLLTAYILDQIPDVTNNPGLVSAIYTAVNDGTKQAFINLAIQLAMAGFAGARAAKIIAAVLTARNSFRKASPNLPDEEQQ